MRLRRVEPGAGLGISRGGAVICITVEGAAETFERCLASLLGHTPGEVPVLIVEDDDLKPGVRQGLIDSADPEPGHEVYEVRQPTGVGIVDTVNWSLAMAGPAD